MATGKETCLQSFPEAGARLLIVASSCIRLPRRGILDYVAYFQHVNTTTSRFVSRPITSNTVKTNFEITNAQDGKTVLVHASSTVRSCHNLVIDCYARQRRR